MPDPLLAEVREVLGRYGLGERPGCEPSRAGSGFSGADVWRVETTIGSLCVRRWPSEHPTAPQLRHFHDVLQTVSAAGYRFVPAALRAADGNTVTLHRGRLWEVTPWMPGAPDDSLRIREARLEAIWRALAAFHLTAFQAGPFRHVYGVPRGPSPGLAERLQKLDYVEAVGLSDLRRADLPAGWESLAERREEYVRLFNAAVRFVRSSLIAVVADPVQLTMCIRDIRREHVLFTGDEVTGWVDFGALALDSPAVDVARVLVEFCDNRRGEWPALLALYEQTCRGTFLEQASLHLIDAFDRSGTLLAPWNWLRWIFLEGCNFADRAAVLARVDQLLTRLRRLVETV